MSDNQAPQETQGQQCEECKCTGWKVGFYIFVALCVITFIILIIAIIKSDKVGVLKDKAKFKVGTKLINKGTKWTNSPQELSPVLSPTPASTVSPAAPAPAAPSTRPAAPLPQAGGCGCRQMEQILSPYQ